MLTPPDDVLYRNIAIHQYEELDLEILVSVATTRLVDWVAYCAALGVKICP